jgi:hypothetical protein
MNDLSNDQSQKREELIKLWQNYSKNVGIVYDPIDLSGVKMNK